MLFGPILLGLLVAPSLPAVFLALVYVAAFLARTPLRMISKNRQRGRRTSRTAAATKMFGIYVFIIVFAVSGVLVTGGTLPLVPAIFALPFAGALLYFDLHATSRRLLPELIAPAVLSTSVAGMVLAAGWDWPYTMAIWSIPLMASLPEVLFVRARLRLDRGLPAHTAIAIVAHILAALIAVVLVRAGLLPSLAGMAILVLLGRALYGLSSYRRVMSIKTLGWSEIGFSLLVVLFSAAGYWSTG